MSKAPFQTINTGYNTVFRNGHLSIGIVVPIENYARSPVPKMHRHLQRAKLADDLGFASLWLRDVPFNVPSFGDAGQPFDPFVYLGLLSAHTERIALGVASVILPLRHPAHVAKAAATADVLSNGRLILGVASGDRPDEYPTMNIPFEERDVLFRESFDYIRNMQADWPQIDNRYGQNRVQVNMLPKPTGKQLPLLVTGSSRQSPEWIAQHSDGWITYPRNTRQQAQVIATFREQVAAANEPTKPVMQPLYVDLVRDDNATPQPIHLGMRLGINVLRDYLKSIEAIGINHVAINLRFNQAEIEDTLKRLADGLLPYFPTVHL